MGSHTNKNASWQAGEVVKQTALNTANSTTPGEAIAPPSPDKAAILAVGSVVASQQLDLANIDLTVSDTEPGEGGEAGEAGEAGEGFYTNTNKAESAIVPALGKMIVLTPDKIAAQRYLTLLDESSEDFTFQTFDDNKEHKVKDGNLARIFNGTLDQHYDKLVELNQRGAGIFVTVNKTDLKGRKLGNMIQPRCVFQEADRSGAPVPPLSPHIVVESSPGKLHRYWLIDTDADPVEWSQWSTVERRMVADFGSDPNAKDPARVLRLPGFYHLKNPAQPHLVSIVEESTAQAFTWDAITQAIPPLAEEPPKHDELRAVAGTGIREPLKTSSALSSIDPDCEYGVWIKIGMALHHACGGGGAGFALFDGWSAEGASYQSGETAYKWASFGRYQGAPVTLASLFDEAQSGNWQWSEGVKAALMPQARAIAEQVIAASVTDPKAYLTPESIEAFAIIIDVDALAYEALRTDLKLSNSKVRVGALDKFVGSISPAGGGEAPSAATQLADLASDRCQLWHDKDRNAYASFEKDVNGRSHTQHWLIESTGFKEWLAWLAHSEMESAPANETLSAARNVLTGKARFDGEECEVFRRVAKDDMGYWIDLGDEHWRAVLITATGWSVVDHPPIRFTRTKSMRPLPVPVLEGDYRLMWPLVNIPEEDRPLVLAWVLETYRCDTPYAVLELIGEQGSAKSSTQKVLRSMIDPNQVMLRGRPKTVEDVYVAGNNNHLVSLENLSGISPEISDALCTMATGGGTATRKHYSNDEEAIMEAHNPVVLNGISAVITRNDLLDRAIALCLPTISTRRTETEINALFERDAPAIFGGLLDLLADTLATIPSVVIPPAQLPRMADFAILGEAMHQACGHPAGEWLAVYVDHRRDAIRRTVDSSPVAMQCMEFVESGKSHSGTIKDLLDKLNVHMHLKSLEQGEYWPRSAKGLADGLRRAAPALRQLGIHLSVDTKPKRDGVHCELRMATSMVVPAGLNHKESSSPSSPSTLDSPESANQVPEVEVYEL